MELDTEASDCALPDRVTGIAKLVAESPILNRRAGGLEQASKDTHSLMRKTERRGRMEDR